MFESMLVLFSCYIQFVLCSVFPHDCLKKNVLLALENLIIVPERLKRDSLEPVWMDLSQMSQVF